MDLADVSASGALFGAVADVYLRAPTPTEVVEWLVDGVGPHVLDAGAGTGRLTRQLAEAAPWIEHLFAIDHDARMLRVARERWPKDGPKLEAYQCRAEELLFGSHRLDGVFLGGTWHWLDQPRALKEFERVLCGGGRLGVVWDLWDNKVPWVAALLAGVGTRVWPGADGPGQFMARCVAGQFTVSNGWRFTPPERMDRTWTWKISVDDAVQSLRTQSTALRMSLEQRRERLAAARDRLAAQVRPGTALVEVPMHTVAYRATRLAVE
jgi:SAM-dependent methyltransferase